jgi:hypothetical protein
VRLSRVAAVVAASVLVATGMLSAAHAQDCIEIGTPAQLQNMSADLDGDYCLANDIDMDGFGDFEPVGTLADPFTGSLDGGGHAIRNLHINEVMVAGAPWTAVGLFGAVRRAVIKDLGLKDVEVNVSGEAPDFLPTGALVGRAFRSRIETCGVTGSVTSVGDYTGGIVGAMQAGSKVLGCRANVAAEGGKSFFDSAGGIAGLMESGGRIAGSGAAGKVVGWDNVGGIVGVAGYGSELVDSYATGPVAGRGKGGTGGLVGVTHRLTIRRSFATGEVRALKASVRLGGLIGNASDEGAWSAPYFTRDAFALGPVRGVTGGFVGGLIGRQADKINRVYAAGAVSVGEGERIGGVSGDNISDRRSRYAYWDTDTTGQSTSSPLHTPLTTNQLQNALPDGFDPAVWAITPDVSYPYLTSPDLDFSGPLAALVRHDRVYVFVPIRQFDNVEYADRPEHPDEASRATVYTMIARAIGFAEDVEALKETTVDVFWDDAAQDTTWTGPVTHRAERGALTELTGAIAEGNVIGLIRQRRVAVLRGLHGPDGDRRPHHMLATSFTVNPNGTVKELVANDPHTGKQVRIDPGTRRVVTPASFPLENYRVTDYQPITLTQGP